MVWSYFKKNRTSTSTTNSQIKINTYIYSRLDKNENCDIYFFYIKMTDKKEIETALYNIEVAYNNINKRNSNSNYFRENNVHYIFSETNDDAIDIDFKNSLVKILTYTGITKDELKRLINMKLKKLEEYKCQSDNGLDLFIETGKKSLEISKYKEILTYLN